MSFIRRLFALFAVIALPLATAMAAPASAPSVDFANKIFAICGPTSVTLTLRNTSTLDRDQVRVIRTAIETQLRALGVRFADNAAPIRITFSQNTLGWLWIAEVTQGSAQKIIMLSIPANEADTAHHGSMSLRDELLFTSDDPVLDVLRTNAPANKALVVLTPTHVLVYQQSGTSWTQQQKISIERGVVMPRDSRGHLVAATDHLFDVYLPGSVCNSNAAFPLAISCRDADDLWPLGGQNAFFNSSRNYFTGLLRPGFGQQVSPFYSATSLPIADRAMWIFSGVDGQVRWTDGAAEQLLGSTSDWGSDIASLHSGCGAGTQVLAASKTDSSGADSLRAYEVLNQQATSVSVPMVFNGTVTALWGQPGESQVIAVTRTAKGSYEAHAIGLSCN